MGISRGTGKFAPRVYRRGLRKSAAAQLSKHGRALLAYLLDAERAMLSGDAGQQLEAKNKGVRWQASSAAAALGVAVPSVARTLTTLEQRRLVACWAEGEGRGRRVHYVKLSAEAVAVAEFHQRTGMSAAQSIREGARRWAERHEDPYET